jgi:hypothetical protein
MPGITNKGKNTDYLVHACLGSSADRVYHPPCARTVLTVHKENNVEVYNLGTRSASVQGARVSRSAAEIEQPTQSASPAITISE